MSVADSMFPAGAREPVIVGAFESPGRTRPGVHPYVIQAECVAGALADAGLEHTEVDGFCTAAGDFGEGGEPMALCEVVEWLGLRPTYFDATDVGGCSPLCHVGHAAAAIATGMADVVVVSYAAGQAARGGFMGTPPRRVDGPGQFEAPFGFSIAGSFALIARRHMAQFGTTSEQLAQIAVTCRAHAAANPDARYREPITVEDVIASPEISSPLHRLDCCVVTDSGGAVVLTSADRAKGCRRAPIRILGFGECAATYLVNQMPDLTTPPGSTSARRALDRCGLRPSDIDVAQLYDAFTITALLGLEDVGFCPPGEAGEMVADGRAITIGGDIPINTDGGGLSSNHPGRRGIFTVVESVRQLRGDGPGVQVAGAQVALAHAVGGWESAAATLLLGSR
jgi:acetyl-CoA C-acetyltransferase